MIDFYGLSSEQDLIPAHDGSWSIQMDGYEVPAQTTSYACQSFTLPMDQDRHVVALRPINVSAYNHHALVHICADNAYVGQHASPQLCSYHPMGSVEGTSSNPSGGQGSSPLGSTASGCNGLLYVWAIGMGDFILPEEAGLRIGRNDIQNIILEIHYDNPAHTTGIVDYMGFEAFYVDTPRAHDAASIIIGDPIVRFGSAIAAQETGDLPKGSIIHREATCPGSCTESMSETINVFGHFHHMHHYGKKIYTERYSVSGEYLGIAGDRIDFWDNGTEPSPPVASLPHPPHQYSSLVRSSLISQRGSSGVSMYAAGGQRRPAMAGCRVAPAGY